MIDISPETKQFIDEHENDDIRALALKAHSYPQIDMQVAIQQIAGRQTARHKLPLWYAHKDIVYPVHLSMEQCSSQSTAEYKATLATGDNIIDLTGGLGVDISFMARGKNSAAYVEIQEQLCKLAEVNFKVLDLSQITVIYDNGVEYLQSVNRIWDTIYIDPARRNNSGRKTVLIEDCTPNLIEIDDLLNQKGKQTIIKLSPMLDITLALQSLTNVTDVHIISVNNECKELLFIKEQEPKETQLHCINISGNCTDSFIYKKSEEPQATATYTDTVKEYLYEPNASMLKAGCFKLISERFNIQKLHINSHLYTSDTCIESFPGRHFRVKRTLAPNKKECKQYLSMPQANISTRNYPFSVAEIRKQIKLKEGGDDYIFATTLVNEKKVLILCEKVIYQ